jgi:hypothetical protein
MGENVIALLTVDRGEHRSSGAAARFAVIVESVQFTDSVCPAIVCGIGAPERSDRRLNIIQITDFYAGRNEAGFFNLDFEFCFATQFKHHTPRSNKWPGVGL